MLLGAVGKPGSCLTHLAAIELAENRLGGHKFAIRTLVYEGAMLPNWGVAADLTVAYERRVAYSDFSGCFLPGSLKFEQEPYHHEFESAGRQLVRHLEIIS